MGILKAHGMIVETEADSYPRSRLGKVHGMEIPR